ncbi:hypothetical protein VWM68_10160, partial [Campylobacter coli]
MQTSDIFKKNLDSMKGNVYKKLKEELKNFQEHDTAVMVHPDDERYKQFIGKELILPLSNKAIKIIADEHVEKEF